MPGEGRAELDRDIDEALALEPDHLSCYELEAKPGTRFTHRHGAELARQAELLEDHYEHVIERLGAAGYRWYETANFCRDGRRAGTTSPTGGAGLPRHRRRRGLDDRARAAHEPAVAGALHRGARARGGAAARRRAADRRGARARADDARAAARRAARRRPGSSTRSTWTGSRAWRRSGSSSRRAGTLTLTRRGRMVANDVVSRVIA